MKRFALIALHFGFTHILLLRWVCRAAFFSVLFSVSLSKLLREQETNFLGKEREEKNNLKKKSRQSLRYDQLTSN